MAKQQKKLGELLVEWGTLSPKDIPKALDHGKKQSLRIGEALVDLKLASEVDVYKALASQHNMEYWDLDNNPIPAAVMNAIPDDLVKRYVILPVGREGTKLRVVVHDPLDLEMLDILRFRLHTDIRTVLAPKTKIKTLIGDMFQTTAANTIDQTIDKMKSSIDAGKHDGRSVDRPLQINPST